MGIYLQYLVLITTLACAVWYVQTIPMDKMKNALPTLKGKVTAASQPRNMKNALPDQISVALPFKSKLVERLSKRKKELSEVAKLLPALSEYRKIEGLISVVESRLRSYERSDRSDHKAAILKETDVLLSDIKKRISTLRDRVGAYEQPENLAPSTGPLGAEAGSSTDGLHIPPDVSN